MNLYRRAADIQGLERLAAGDSPVHRLHPGVKIAVTLVYIVTVISFPPGNTSALVALVFYPAVLMPLSGTPWRFLLPRLAAALPFVLAAALGGFVQSRETALRIGGPALSRGLVFSASITLKTLLTVTAVLLLAASTPFMELGRQLVRMGLPKSAVFQLLMTYRYTGLLIREAAAMFTAYILRSPRSRLIHMRDMGIFLGQLLIRSFDRAGAVYAAMKCRGFDGEYQGVRKMPLRPAEAAGALVVSALIAAPRFFNLTRFLGSLAGRLR